MKVQKLFTLYSKLIFSFSYVFITIAFGCKISKEQDEYHNLSKAMHKLGVNFNTQASCVFILDDQGCLSCNNLVSDNLRQYLLEDKVIFVITANPNKIDLSSFIENQKNVYFDNKKTIFSHIRSKKSAIYFIKENKIDTFMDFTAEHIYKDIKIIKSKLDCL